MREEFSTLFPLCTHELALSTGPGAEAREKLTLQEKLAYAGIRTPDLTSRRFRGYQLDHRGDRRHAVRRPHRHEFGQNNGINPSSNVFHRFPSDDNLVVRCGLGPTRGDIVHAVRHCLRSPPRMTSSRGPSIVFPIFNSASVGEDQDDVEASLVSQGHGTSLGKVTGGPPGRQSIGGDGQETAIDGQTSTAPKTCSQAYAGRAVAQNLSQQGLISSGFDNGNGTLKIVAAAGAAAPGVKERGQDQPTELYGPAATASTATQSSLACHGNNREKQPTSSCINRAVQDNWGTVFVVGGGRRRRRTVVRQRSVEVEETPAARRAQVEKERQERRKASLRRLMARKEQRAVQQALEEKEEEEEDREDEEEGLTTPTGSKVDAVEAKETRNRGDAIDVLDNATERRRPAHGNGIGEAGSTPVPEDGDFHGPSLANPGSSTTPKSFLRENVVDQKSKVAVALNKRRGEAERPPKHPNAAAAIPVPLFSLESGMSADADPVMNDHHMVDMNTEKAGTMGPGPDEWEEVSGQRYGPQDDDCDSDNTEGSGATLEIQGPLHVQPVAENRQAKHRSAKRSTGYGSLVTVTPQPPNCDAGETKQGRKPGLIASANGIVCVSDVDLAAPRMPPGLSLSAPTLACPRLSVSSPSMDHCSPSDGETGNDCADVGVEPLLPEPPARRMYPPEGHSQAAAGRKEGTGDNWKAHSNPKAQDCRDVSKQSYSAGDEIVDNTSAKFTVEPRHAFATVPQGRRPRRSGTPPVTGTGDDGSKATCLQVEVPETPGVAASGDVAGHLKPVEKVPSSNTLATYTDCFPRFAAILSAHHNGRALTRQADCRSLPLTSKILSRGKADAGGSAANRRRIKELGLTGVEEEACLYWQWKLYNIHVRVIKDYAAVFSCGDGWSGTGTSDASNSLVYSHFDYNQILASLSKCLLVSGDSSALHYRVNSKARPEVYNIVTDVLNNRCQQWEELPTGLGLKTTWNLLWTWSKPHIQYSSLLTWQKVITVLSVRSMSATDGKHPRPSLNKNLLNKHMSRFMAPGGRLAKEFHIMPQTFVLPHEFTLFVSAFTSSSGKRENLWIMKPVGMSRGRGIRLIDDIKDICYADKVVLQRYIGNPLLLDGYKFDLRLYVLVTSFNKLEAFIYKEGFARLSTHRYEKGDIDNRFIHLTNSSIQRLNEAGAARDSPLNQAKTSEAGGTKTTLSYLWRRLAASGLDVGALWAEICSVVVKSLVCVESSIPNQPNRQVKLRPWLIEVNASPSMARDTHVDRQVKEALIFETVHLIDPLPFDRQKLVDILGRRLDETEHSKTRAFKQRHYPHHHQQAFDTTEVQGDARAGDNFHPSPSAKASANREHQRPRRTRGYERTAG
ncbi:unnamed protein product [Ectocarpus sp. CCAP 1310/34]|nr:unnamed protein product [Ectocarpus sp. CCAP 1310/34]